MRVRSLIACACMVPMWWHSVFTPAFAAKSGYIEQKPIFDTTYLPKPRSPFKLDLKHTDIVYPANLSLRGDAKVVDLRAEQTSTVRSHRTSCTHNNPHHRAWHQADIPPRPNRAHSENRTRHFASIRISSRPSAPQPRGRNGHNSASRGYETAIAENGTNAPSSKTGCTKSIRTNRRRQTHITSPSQQCHEHRRPGGHASRQRWRCRRRIRGRSYATACSGKYADDAKDTDIDS
jgi:hypothetical protein